MPSRIDIPGERGWVSATVGRALDGENEFEARVDNGGPMLTVTLKRPDELNTFAAFAEYSEDGADDEEAYQAFMLTLPLKPEQPIDVVLDGKKVKGRIAKALGYSGGERLLVLDSASKLIDATVCGEPLNAGSLYRLEGGGSTVQLDLNEYNHCMQTLPSAKAYVDAREAYLESIVSSLSKVEDAITGNWLSIDDQLVYITVETETTPKMGKQADGDGSGGWASIASMADLAELLVAPSPDRKHGTHVAQGVLVRAGPGTGKTVSLQQLTRLLALKLKRGTAAGSEGVALVPLFVSVQRLAAHMNSRAGWGGDDLLGAYIEAESEGEARRVLLQAYAMRALVVCIDGVDEAAGLKNEVEDLVLERLAPCQHVGGAGAAPLE